MTKPETPFKPAQWNETYTLAGAEWTPYQCAGMIVQSKCMGNTNQLFATVRNGKDISGGLWFETTTGMGVGGSTAVPPLLPSPDWINAQADPRAVAIAALERAGFVYGNIKQVREVDGTWLYIELGDQAGLYVVWEALGTRKPINPAKVFCELRQTDDPALARYAVDCFAVLCLWSAAIHWEATNE